ncbi:MAG TPA: UDP-N-acetylmuramate dehydrogenase [Rhodanobacteraceae bacterium]|nr:UDP-N-acetylmuramate dehydrogenase [Rhodanobacteraceae bacterium]
MPAGSASDHFDRHRVGFELTANASLLHRNTLRVDARAAWLAEIHDVDAIPVLLADRTLRGKTPLLLGEGSNVLFAGDYNGAVVTMKTRGVEVISNDADAARIRVAAGEHWDDLVRWTLAQGHPGLENLILIPGSVGAAPMQNIGAYGVEVGEFIESVEAFDLQEHRALRFDNRQCEFGYRDSVFKRHPDHWLITAVTLRLPGTHAPCIDYAGLREELERIGVTNPGPVHVAEAVVNLRTRKLPDPAVIGNAGSFFKNPIIPAAQAAALRHEYPQLPCWDTDGGAKLSAAWLIEASGFKGLRDGDAGISRRHALVLVNHGRASGAELWALARRVRDGVRERFGVTLEPEPRIIGDAPP